MPNILSDYQVDAIRRMHNGCILCGDVGSGKSRTALAYYYKENGGDIDSLTSSEAMYVRMRSPPQDLYIITTAKKRDSHEWNEEMVPFLMASSNTIYHNKIVVDSWNNLHKYKDVKGAFFILDEQRVVGYGEWTKSFLVIAKSNKWILLSATPGDSWMDYMPVFIANGFYRNKTDFTSKHVIYKRFSKYPQVDRYLNTDILMWYRKQVVVVMYYKHITPSEHNTIYCDYDKGLYSFALGRKNPWVVDSHGANVPIANASEYCSILRKIVNMDVSRSEAIMDIIKSHPRVIIFYNFNYELEILRDLFTANGIIYSEWNGHLHQDIPKGDEWAFLVQYNAGAEGWNCVRTDTMIFYSQHYSYKIMKQAAGRIDRRNTPWPKLYYYHLKSRSGIDCAISKTLNEKKDFNASTFVKW